VSGAPTVREWTQGGSNQVVHGFRWRSVWRVAGSVDEVISVLADVESFPRWWPSVYRSVKTLSDGRADGVGRRVALRTTGWLPYSLRWVSTLTEPVTARGFAVAASGDMIGTGTWAFEQDGPEVVLTFDWSVSASKPLIRQLSWLCTPLFAANHRWSMARGEESLRLELRRRRTGSTHQVPRPPRVTFAAAETS
jgi:Polyketide cyclase / dehydrase and lipid transport